MKEQDSPGFFRTTHWSLVHRAVETESESANQALEEICTAYWYPLYGFIRRQGHNVQDAEDLTQGFFTKLLTKEILGAADREKGHLRSFLLTCLRRYLSDQRDRRFAEKRGSEVTFSLDTALAEERYSAEPASGDLPPDRLFQRRWAITLLEFSLNAIRLEFANRGKADLFAALRPFLGLGETSAESYEVVACRLGMPVGTFKSHVSRVRERWREVLFEQVAMTLDEPTSDNIKAELAELKEWL
ncbi:MAG: RNA polymerase subunit sigma-24 [Verrucomicrobiales bacterium]|jgi:DNA-directed RNA polymerase specialized sigma24 family protein|nr:RNA polymerase subunit sigma-24 [Verrucomicrobiales bacterium]MBP9223773.1 RNA polymerase subunit sigma-24 [Verrucomicrobiales bacterium]HQZ27534.1 RNA polymerase subunit sigma-24 [Verrucomicrobiales bacterium]